MFWKIPYSWKLLACPYFSVISSSPKLDEHLNRTLKKKFNFISFPISCIPNHLGLYVYFSNWPIGLLAEFMSRATIKATNEPAQNNNVYTSPGHAVCIHITRPCAMHTHHPAMRYAYTSPGHAVCIHITRPCGMHTHHPAMCYAYTSPGHEVCIHITRPCSMHTHHPAMRYAYTSPGHVLCIHITRPCGMYTHHPAMRYVYTSPGHEVCIHITRP